MWSGWVICLVFSVFTDGSIQQAHAGAAYDAGDPLILTPYLESSKIDEAKSLSRVPPLVNNITSYSGYMTVDKTCGSNMFFWFFPAEADYINMPVAVWLQGGPGSSSMYGLFGEIGPLLLTPDNVLKQRPFAWTRVASYLFIDNPVGTGFSFVGSGTPEECFSRNETAIGKNLLSVVKQFYLLFPELKNNELFVTGESYAGKYVPALSYAIHKDNQNSNAPINLVGLAIGNGLVDPPNMLHYGDYLYQLGLIDTNTREVFYKEEDNCRALIADEKWAEAFVVFDRLMMGDLTGYPSYFANVTKYNHYFNYLLSEPPKEGDLQKLFDDSKIREAIHVGSTKFLSGSAEVETILQEDVMKSVVPWLEELLENYRVLIYNGQLDIIVAYPLTEAYLKKLKWSGANQYATALRNPWYFGESVAGYVKTAGKLTEIMVRNAGHMVPLDQPRWALSMMKKFFTGGTFSKRPEHHLFHGR